MVLTRINRDCEPGVSMVCANPVAVQAIPCCRIRQQAGTRSAGLVEEIHESLFGLWRQGTVLPPIQIDLIVQVCRAAGWCYAILLLAVPNCLLRKGGHTKTKTHNCGFHRPAPQPI